MLRLIVLRKNSATTFSTTFSIMEAEKRPIRHESLVLELGARSSKQGNQKQKKRIHWSVGSAAMLVLPTFAFSLGCWQVYRLRWKLNLLESLEARLDQAAVPLPTPLDRETLKSLEYCRVRVSGTFLHDREFIISPRGRFDPGQTTSASTGSLLSENDLSSHGGHIITPFRLESSGEVILVNRGWVPQFLFDPEARTKTQPRGVVFFDAIVRKTEKRPQFVGQNIPERGVWYYRDLEQMAKTYGTLPVWVDAAFESTIPGGPIGGQTNVNIRNEHLQYLLTWFSLTAVTLAMWLHRFRR
ncbi:unnamed protein product [Caenorhabditis auriculariae]|uniref:SURF1-like protein n=1 Tax=Caenorhabditis auriculariae TaxID=2777116 RepID=A0A8S1GRT1_9PELO|nr:unnamed protein product [Caenorhabditis auriculariae]